MTEAEKVARALAHWMREEDPRRDEVEWATRILRFAREYGQALASPPLREVMVRTYCPTTDTHRLEKMLTGTSALLSPMEDTTPSGRTRTDLGRFVVFTTPSRGMPS